MIKKLLDKKTKKIFFTIVLCFFLALLAVAGKRKFYYTFGVDYNTGTNVEKVDAAEGVFIQDLSSRDMITSIELLMESKSATEQTLHAKVVDAKSQETLTECDVQVAPSSGNEEVVALPITLNDVPEQIQLVLSVSTDAKQVYYLVNDYGDNLGHLRMSVHNGTKFAWELYISYILLLLAVATVCLVKLSKEKMFAILALAGGIAFSFTIPAAQECDGWTHFLNAMDVANGNIFGSFVNLTHAENEILVPQNLMDFQYRIVYGGSTDVVSYIQNLKQFHFSKEMSLITHNFDITTFYYWPQAFGIRIGLLFNMSAYWIVVMSRFMNLLTYVSITYMAIKVMPIYKNLMMVIALLPITLSQAASDSPDALLNSLCFLFVALSFYYAYQKDEVTLKNTICLGGILAVIFMCKYVYALVGLLVFLIPVRKFGSWRKYLRIFAISILPFVVVAGYLAATRSGIVTSQYQVVTMEDGVGVVDVGMTQLQYAIANPTFLLHVLRNTLWYQTNELIVKMGYFGSFTYSIPFFFTTVPCYVVAVSCLDKSEMVNKLKLRDRGIILFTAVGITTAVGMAIFLFDSVANPTGQSVILGLQGRYFIPVLILPFIAFGCKGIKNEINNFPVRIAAISGAILTANIYLLNSTIY